MPPGHGHSTATPEGRRVPANLRVQPSMCRRWRRLKKAGCACASQDDRRQARRSMRLRCACWTVLRAARVEKRSGRSEPGLKASILGPPPGPASASSNTWRSSLCSGKIPWCGFADARRRFATLRDHPCLHPPAARGRKPRTGTLSIWARLPRRFLARQSREAQAIHAAAFRRHDERLVRRW